MTQKAWKEAQAAGYATLKSARRTPTSTKRRRTMMAAQARAECGKAQLKAARSRSDLITKFVREPEYHTTTKMDVSRSALRVLAQIPLIEAEMEEEAGVGAIGAIEAREASRVKRGRDRTDHYVTDEPSPKKQRRSGRQTSSLADGSFSAAVGAGETSRRRRTEEDGDLALAEPRFDHPVRPTAVTIHQLSQAG